MDRDGVLARVGLLCAATERPALSADDLGTIVDAFQVPDASGVLFTEEGYTPTWDVNGAVAEAFRVKAARVAADFTFSADDGSFSKGEVMAKLLQMADEYGQRGLRVIPAGADRATGPYDSPRLLVN